MSTRPIPDGYEGVTPYLIVDGAAKAIDFYVKVFGGTEVMRMPGPNGRIGHAELRIGRGHVMLADQNPEMGYRAPSPGGNSISLLVYADDCDAVIERARRAGAKVTREPADQFYGDRSGGFTDPFGHDWYVSTHVRDVSEEDMRRLAEERASAAERK